LVAGGDDVTGGDIETGKRGKNPSDDVIWRREFIFLSAEKFVFV
jgi:hypothetical protein